MKMKTALITGCNRGLGAGIRDILIENGYKVIGLNRTLSDFKSENYIEIKCDISKFEEVENAKNIFETEYEKENTNENNTSLSSEKTENKKRNISNLKDSMINNLEGNGIDLLIVNAGIRRFEKLENMSNKDWENSVNTNLNGAFYVLNKFIPSVKKAKGDVVIIGSHSEKYTFEDGSAYCSTKLALRGMAECLREELRYEDIRVSYLSIGSIKNRDHGIDEEWKLMPEELGETVLSLVNLPKKVFIPYLDIRPLKPLRDTRKGIEKLQYV